jgi:hypothetical protein
MANVKYKQMEQISGWIEFRLATKLLDPPVLRLRLRPIDLYNVIDEIAVRGNPKLGSTTLSSIVEAVADWDLSADGVPIALSPENKMGWLRPLVTERIDGEEDGSLLGVAILLAARNRENFVKN